jgi:2'-5' RNA ligase
MLKAAQTRCEEVLAGLGFPPEGRAYFPHLTLGRVKDFHAGRQIILAVEQMKPQAAERLAQAATEITLFQSILRPQGSQYIAMHKVMLRKD